ncbi:protein translocase subunit SecD [Cognaticolwellia beringensis]|uniref:Protein translocase subunit SecD n=1 Tax=Cognaticolwellia beringensis TaxID=1967665 RepID=A0A222GAI5_9GAMM|nr:protein translocase subunit SecD [Cognaticolwellia beringensis]ASP48810.1 protein translocase subunit SecD [Cognaticolwellia beringensis]
MNTRNKSTRKYFSWQNAVILITLIFMIINALPNLYPEKVSIQLTSNSSQIEQTSPQKLNTFLQSNQLEAEKITTSASGITITLANKADELVAKDLLKAELGERYTVDSAIDSNAPAWFKSMNMEPIKLGLDLSGGVLFVLDVDTERALFEHLKGIAVDIKTLSIENRIRGITLTQPTNNSIDINFPSSMQSKVEKLLSTVTQSAPELSINKISSTKITLLYPPQEQVKFRQTTMKHTLKAMRGRIEELGITEAVTQQQGKNRIRIELPGVHNPEEAKRIIGATATLDFYQLADSSNTAGIMHMTDSSGRKLSLNSKAVFSGSSIKNARAGQDEMGLPLVNLTLDSIGGKKMSTFSKANIGKPMVTVFSEFHRNSDNEIVKKSKIINVANISQHLGSQFSITHMSSPQAAQELSLLLRAGSLNAPVTIVMQRNIEATLGADNIDNGIKALSIGIVFTLLFMAVWYRTLGVIANVALALNLVSLLGLMSLLPGAVLTLPGIAGLVLTVGMAVDANVLIFERIKEELRRGRQTLSAIETGYKSAFSTILDANITTMITGIILYTIGYGPVKGFAIILCLGILTSMFTGVFVAKALTNMVIRENKSHLMGIKSANKISHHSAEKLPVKPALKIAKKTGVKS